MTKRIIKLGFIYLLIPFAIIVPELLSIILKNENLAGLYRLVLFPVALTVFNIISARYAILEKKSFIVHALLCELVFAAVVLMHTPMWMIEEYGNHIIWYGIANFIYCTFINVIVYFGAFVYDLYEKKKERITKIGLIALGIFTLLFYSVFPMITDLVYEITPLDMDFPTLVGITLSIPSVIIFSFIWARLYKALQIHWRWLWLPALLLFSSCFGQIISAQYNELFNAELLIANLGGAVVLFVPCVIMFLVGYAVPEKATKKAEADASTDESATPAGE